MEGKSESARILAIHAHPDDVEFQCAGTLSKLSQQGCHVTIATMTPGDCGSQSKSSEAISAIRRAEAARSAEMIGAEYHCLEFRDLTIIVDQPSRQRVTEFVRRVSPDLVITAPPVDYMSDHEFTSRLVRDACFNAPIPNYRTDQWDPAGVMARIPHLYYVDPLEGSDLYGRPVQPQFIVDITDSFESKLQMLACHDSQRSWLQSQHGMDEYLESCRRWSASRGKEIGSNFGEGFRQHLGHPYPTSNLLQELLPNAVKPFKQHERA